jgi:hypothetical protein
MIRVREALFSRHITYNEEIVIFQNKYILGAHTCFYVFEELETY